MAQLTLRTLLAYLDDTLDPHAARELGKKVAESEVARELIERIKKITRRRRLATPDAVGDDEDLSDPNTVAQYLSNTLDSEQVQRLEQACLDSDAYLAEVAACHQILTVVLAEPVRVPPKAKERMYKLAPAGAGSAKARTRPALPVIGGTPAAAAADRPEADDPDAALLLGMNRFGAGSAARRARMAAAAVGIAALLGVAVYKALPGPPPDAPPTAPAEYAALTPAPAPRPGPTPAPKPTEPEPAPSPPENVTPPAEPAPPPHEKVKGPPRPAVPAARADRLAVGKATQVNTLLVGRANPEAEWIRLDPAGDGTVNSSDELVCLPGYKADVKLDTGVQVSFWGNLPELLPARLLESRVRFHAPTPKADGGGFEFDADLTLLGGRIYLSPTKGEERVRVRAGGEVFDLTLPERAEVAVELTRAYEPGVAAALRAGPPPRTDVKLAVIRGSAAVSAVVHGKKFDKVDAPAVIAWDSKAPGRVTGPTPIDKGNAYFDKFLLVPSEQGKNIQKALSEVASRVAAPDRVPLLMTELVSEPPAAGNFVRGLIGVYGLAALATSSDDLKVLVDVLTDEQRGPQRIAAATALAAWLARDPGNPAKLAAVLEMKLPAEGAADLVIRLLRGVLNPANPDPAELDRLVDLLASPSAAVRELALWNLINFADPAAARTPGLAVDVGNATGPAYDKFVKAWRARVEEIKKGPAPKEAPTPAPMKK